MSAFNIKTNNFVFSSSTPQTFDCLLMSGADNVSVYVNDTSTPSTLPANTNFNFINLSDVNYFRLNSPKNFNLVCAYQPTKQEATTTLPADFINSTYLIAGVLIFGFIIFIGSLIFRYVRF
jgi:hypothetical protein